MKNITITNGLQLIFSIVICELAGVIGAIFSMQAISTWYYTLDKPIFNPPNWIFAPVWTLLFALMGISVFLIWKSNSVALTERKLAIQIFVSQLCLNILWSILFFGLHSPSAALVEIISLLAMIIATLFVFDRISKIASYILIPYLAWVSFASVLNFTIWFLN